MKADKYHAAHVFRVKTEIYSMLARRSRISHSLAGDIDLPLLVPAFSSKGFDLRKTGEGDEGDQFSEIAYALEEFGQYPANTALISGYDLHFQHFNAPELSYEPYEYLRRTGLVFIDSGGYELVPDFDLTEPRTYLHQPKLEKYKREQYEAVLRGLTSLEEPLPLVIANFDYGSRGSPLQEQVEEARSLFYSFPDCLSNFIIKPWTEDESEVNPDELSHAQFADLRGFDIIGVTEKELGEDPLTRLKRVARLRKGLDSVDRSVPIHIWGGLDPVMTPLFFFAGAQIFDGVSWLRYGFRNGVAINREYYSILNDGLGVDTRKRLNDGLASLHNRRFLEKLAVDLQRWVKGGGTSFDMFHSDVRGHLEQAYEVMKSQIPDLEGGE